MHLSETAIAAVALGSNLDDPATQVRRAFDELRQLPGTSRITCSPLYRSAAIGPDGRRAAQPDFCNAAAMLDTALPARALLERLQAIERAHGRHRGLRWAARSLDLDLLVHGARVMDEPGLTLPHPRLHERNFVLFPLRDIAPELMIPGLATVRELAAQVGSEGVEPWLN